MDTIQFNFETHSHSLLFISNPTFACFSKSSVCCCSVAPSGGESYIMTHGWYCDKMSSRFAELWPPSLLWVMCISAAPLFCFQSGDFQYVGTAWPKTFRSWEGSKSRSSKQTLSLGCHTPSRSIQGLTQHNIYNMLGSYGKWFVHLTGQGKWIIVNSNFFVNCLVNFT